MKTNSCTDAQALERSAERGWMFPYLLALDVFNISDVPVEHRGKFAPQFRSPPYIGPHRWDYWLWIIEHNTLPPEPIPEVRFRNFPQNADAKAVQDVLQYAARRHYMGYDEAWLYMVRWLLHGFGKRGLQQDVEHIPEDVRATWYRDFNLAWLLNSPCDWPAFILQGGLRDDKRNGARWAKSSGFFSTPMEVCAMMALMQFLGDRLRDYRLDTVCDPCVGTGSMLLAASNYSLRLYGQDIVYNLTLCCELNGWLWMPWLVKMPDKTRAMLEERYAQQQRLLKMRNILLGNDLGQRPAENGNPAPVGRVVQSDNPITAQLSEQRAEGAKAYYE